eukprot:UN00979
MKIAVQRKTPVHAKKAAVAKQKVAKKKVAKKSSPKHKTVRNFTSAIEAGEPVAFVGLGEMGGHMAHNLMKKGHDLVVFDLNEANVNRAIEQGKALGKTVKIAKSPADAALQADVLITMLPSSPHVKETYVGPNGVFSTFKQRQADGRKKLLLIDSSTIAPPVALELANIINEQYSDAAMVTSSPVSGGVMGAANGTLTFMTGGKTEAFNAARPFLEKMGKNIVHCGEQGNTGQIAKVVNNLILGISMNAISEGYALGVKLGADPKMLASIINTSSGRCWASEVSNPVPGVMENVPSSRDYQGGFGNDLMLKDMRLALDAAKDAGVELKLGKIATDNYAAISESGNGKKDFGYVYQHVLNQKNSKKKKKKKKKTKSFFLIIMYNFYIKSSSLPHTKKFSNIYNHPPTENIEINNNHSNISISPHR